MDKIEIETIEHFKTSKILDLFYDKNFSELCKHMPEDIKNVFHYLYILNYCKIERKKGLNNRTHSNGLMKNYKEIISNTTILAKELNITNSLELSNLFTYLLWNGYFSSDQRLVYKLEDKNNITGLLPMDIMQGKGVCLNFSEMLKDLLNKYGFCSSTMISDRSSQVLINYYTPPITKCYIKPKSSTIIKNKLLSLLLSNTGNHAFNLINEDGKFYIYDPTNIAILELENVNSSRMISGNGQFKLYPYLSYSLNYTKKDMVALNELLNTEDFTSPYDKQTYIETWKSCIEKFNESRQLISDFYDDTKENIDNVANRLILKK